MSLCLLACCCLGQLRLPVVVSLSVFHCPFFFVEFLLDVFDSLVLSVLVQSFSSMVIYSISSFSSLIFLTFFPIRCRASFSFSFWSVSSLFDVTVLSYCLFVSLLSCYFSSVALFVSSSAVICFFLLDLCLILCLHSVLFF